MSLIFILENNKLDGSWKSIEAKLKNAILLNCNRELIVEKNVQNEATLFRRFRKKKVTEITIKVC